MGVIRLMNCETANPGLTEAARKRGGLLDADLQRHVDTCAACAAHWQEQRDLSARLRILRLQSGDAKSGDTARSRLLNEFAARRPQPARGRKWAWSLAAAAAALIAAFAIHEVRTPPVPVEVAVDAESEAREEGFIDVPFAPPLAPGEMVRVVHTALQPAALASMGVNVDPTWTAELPADVLVGEDGFPRAVRVSNEGSSEAADGGSEEF